MKLRPIDASNIERIVVRGTNWVGDSIMTVPALRELRRVLPNARITLATRSWSKGLFEDADFVDELLISSGSIRKEISDWSSGKFDLAVLFTNSFQTAFIARAAGIRYRIGYRTERRGFLLSHALSLPAWRKERHEVHYYLNIISELENAITGSSSVRDRAPEISLSVSSTKLDQARALLRSRGATLDRPVVVLCPGSTNSRAKRWPSDRFAAVGDMIIERLNATVVLVGSPAESEVSNEVSGMMKSRPVNLTGQTELSDLVPVLALADVVLTNDTGPAHIAAALNRPVAVIFGPTDPVTTRPFSDSSVVIREPPDCAPCMLRDCPIDHRCMTAITPDSTFAVVRELMSQRSAIDRAVAER